MKSVHETERLLLRDAEAEDAGTIREYLLKNRAFLKAWEPSMDESFFELASIERRIKERAEEISSKKALSKYIFLKSTSELIGYAGVTNIIYGAFQSGFLGYKLSEHQLNQGYMTEALKSLLAIAFVEYKLHRVEANVLPENIRSKRVLEKLGFIYEGSSEKYLQINGQWREHEHFVLFNE